MTNRPYCLSELKSLEKDLYLKHRLSDIEVVHHPCMHRYKVKKGGRKEQYLLNSASNLLDDQTCSVCFKVRTGGQNPPNIDRIISSLSDSELSRSKIDDLNFFYSWLYRHDY